MAGIVTQQPGVANLTMASTDGMGGEVYSRRSAVKAPEPNPNFSFPRLPQNPSEVSSSTDHPRKRIRPQNLSLLPKPPTEQLEINKEPEPTSDSSPGKSRPMSARSMGHRRGGSEFIGGDGTATGPGLMSSSPTKGVASLPSPPVSSGRRRGHAHRRSGAMSTNDFSAMLNSTGVPPVPGSAPATPSGHAHNIPPVPTHSLERHHSQPIMMTTREKIDEANAAGEKEDRELAATPRNATSRPRVGFSEKVEFIPRPLSTISAETTSTISTIKASHSVNGSISSLLDQRPPTPVSTSHPIDSSDDSRPTTSDTASSSQPEIFGAPEEIDEASDRPASASGKALFFKQRRRSPPPPPRTWQDDNISPGTTVESQFLENFSADSLTSPGLVPPPTAGSSDSGSTEIKQEKRKSRMRSILSRKSRKHSKEEVPSASPPIVDDSTNPNAPAGLVSLEDVNFDEDTSLVIHSADYKKPRPAPFQPSPQKGSFDNRDDNAVLDLDATYNSISIDDDSPQKFANFVRGGTALPARQHRRTESAPSLSPVQRQGFGAGKASPQMADVFEEDEEEESVLARNQRPKARSFNHAKTGNLHGLGVQIVDADAGEAMQPRRKSRSPSSKTADTDKASTSEGDLPMPDLPVEVAALDEEPRFSMVTKSSDEETITPTGLETSPQPQIASPPHPLDFALPPSLRPHAHNDSSDLSNSSAAPSPNPTTISFDAPRLNTAASSMTDRTNWSANQSQQVSSATTTTCRGDESAASEDVPSLTSSASTAFSGHPSHPSTSTNASSASPSPIVPRGPGAAMFGSNQAYHAHTVSGMSRPRTSFIPSDSSARPSSVGADRAFSLAGLGGLSSRASMPRNWSSRPSTANGSKRSSLASLSRLMSKGNESERSKLSISWGAGEGETGAEGRPATAKDGKDKGGKRKLSRMFKFWKGREKERELAPETPTTLAQEPSNDTEMTVD